MQDEYPDPSEYTTPHPLLVGIHAVQSTSDPDIEHEVNLDTGECTCPVGQAFRWSNKKWTPNQWCSHKLKVAASILDGTKGDKRKELQAVYNRLLGSRYIIWESVSAFHKELRRGDEEHAQYWALSVAAHRGLNGVVRYMLNILFEETRDLDLMLHLMRLGERGRNISFDETMIAVRMFCRSPKKWQLKGRFRDIYLNEMRGYRSLASEYGYAVARGKDIIPETENKHLKDSLIAGLIDGDIKSTQYGLKGYFKSIYPYGHPALKIDIFNVLTDALNNEGPFTKGIGFAYNKEYTQRVQKLVLRRYQSFGDIGYHELNALCDALSGEHYPSGDNTLPRHVTKFLARSQRSYTPPLGVFRRIPLYALDNHNHRGKHLMRKWGPSELQPGVKQHNIDFRMCGAYMGVAWRYLAQEQHGSTEIGWEQVKWSKVSWLWKHVDQMFY